MYWNEKSILIFPNMSQAVVQHLTVRTSTWSILLVQLLKWFHSFSYCIHAEEHIRAHKANQLDMKEVHLYIWIVSIHPYIPYIHTYIHTYIYIYIYIAWITVVWSMLLASSYTHQSDSAEIVETSGHGSVVNWCFKGLKYITYIDYVLHWRGCFLCYVRI